MILCYCALNPKTHNALDLKEIEKGICRKRSLFKEKKRCQLLSWNILISSHQRLSLEKHLSNTVYNSEDKVIGSSFTKSKFHTVKIKI